MPNAPNPRSIALLVYPGCALIDVALSLQSLAPLAAPYRLTTVAARIRPISSSGSLRLLAERTFADVPRPAALIVPGGGPPTLAALADRELIGYVRSAAAHAVVTAAIGAGSLVLATAGVLQDRPATTEPAFASALQELGATYRPAALVESGGVLTAAHPADVAALMLALVDRLHVPPFPVPQGDVR